MNYKDTAKQIYDAIGKKENIISAAHCATRLRLVIANNKEIKKEVLENIEGVKGVFEASGQLQIILGTGVVNKVFDEFIVIAGIEAQTKDEVKKIAAEKQNIFKRAVKTLGDIFVPIIPAIVASGLLMGLLEGLCKVYPQMAESGTYTIVHLFSNAAFVFLPILIAMSAAKTFGGNIYLGAVIGMIMIHPDLLNAWGVATAESIPKASTWFGLFETPMVGYQGHVIPVVIAVWIMSIIEKKLHKIVPEIIDLFVTPFLSVLITGYLTLTIIGPVFSVLENYVLKGAGLLITLPFGIGAFLTGAAYAPTVVAGVHHMYNALEAGLLSSTNLNTWMPIATAANVGQAGAALAVALKTKNKKLKSMALPASLSAFLGITEPAIFGVNIRFMKAFAAGCIGGACGALIGSILKVGASAYGVTGLFGFLITTDYTIQYLILMSVSIGVSFILSWFMFKDENQNTNSSLKKNEKEESETIKEIFGSPIEGETISLSDVPDKTFSSEMLGKGIAIIPSAGKVVSPCDGKVTTVFDTKHAIGVTSSKGAELLIHIGLDTVKLNGKYFTVYVKEGEEIKKGDVIASFDVEKIKEAGYDTVTPFLITNTDQYKQIEAETGKEVKISDTILSAK